MVFCCCSPSASGFDVLCVQRWYSVYIDHSRSAVYEILRPACLAPTTIPRSKSLKSTFFPILMLGLNFSKSSSPHLDWLISHLCYQAIEHVYLRKWLVSVYIPVYIYSTYFYFVYINSNMYNINVRTASKT